MVLRLIMLKVVPYTGFEYSSFQDTYSRWSGGAMVLGKLPVLGRPTIWMIVGQEPIAL